VDERLPALSFLPMSAPEAERQIVAGIYGLEGDRWRWTSGQAVVLLKRPARPSPLVVNFVVPDQSPARRIVVTVDGAAVLEHAVRSKGPHTLATTSAVSVRGNAARVAFTIDATFSPPGEQRRLGVILLDIGFRMEAGP
jgi:hypothetical protein